MKRIALTTSVILFGTIACFATIRTVSNLPFLPGQYDNPNDAIAAAVDGDTIYIHGSTINYGIMFIGRSVVVIGPGHHPDKQVPLPAMFTDVTVGAANVQVIGITLEVLSSSFDGGVVRRCRIVGRASASSLFINADNWLVEGCLFDRWGPETSIYFFDRSGHIVQHNLFATPGPKIQGINSSGVPAQIINNVFLGDGFNFNAFSDFNNVIIRNNIFYGQGAYAAFQVGTMTNLTIDHNITYGALDPDFYPAGSFPINLINTDPMFINPGSIGTAYVHPGADYDLQAASPGQGYAQDGSRIGVFGGFAQFFTPIYTTSGEPSIAVIQIFNITSPTTVPPGGTLNITVTSRRVP